MQLMPSTATELGVKDSFSPEQNVHGGAQYLQQLLDRYNGDAVKALAAYNAGPAAVDRYNGVPPYRETRQYVRRVVHNYNRSKQSPLKGKSPDSSRDALQKAGETSRVERAAK
jgi:soluble lytic murein transglycosylase-like protein